MRLVLLGTALLALALPVTALHPGNFTGPFTGSVVQGETDAFLYDNNPHNEPCIDVMATYTVALQYTPATDTLALTVAGQTVLVQGGFGAVVFQAPYCTSFDIAVTGVAVATVAKYTVTVDRSVGGPVEEA